MSSDLYSQSTYCAVAQCVPCEAQTSTSFLFGVDTNVFNKL